MNPKGCRREARGLWRAVLAVAVVCALLVSASSAFASGTAPKRVLVVFSNTRMLRANVLADRGFREALVGVKGEPVQVFDEFLDIPRFQSARYADTMVRYLREKYAENAPDVVVVFGEDALRFMVERRDALDHRVPVVFGGVTRQMLAAIPGAAAAAVGVPFEYDFRGTIEQALAWHRDARRLVIVTGASRQDRAWEAELRALGPGLASRAEVEFLSGLPTSEMISRIERLENAVVFTPGYFVDGEGREFLPREIVTLICERARVPVYSGFASQIGVGIVGTRAPDFEAVGRQAGEIAKELLRTGDPASIRLPEPVPAPMNVDWRQLERWGIDEEALPADVVVHFRTPSFFQLHWPAVVVALAIVLLQAALIAVLLAERRRRRLAEVAQIKQRMELAHASRLAVAGELTASIAHEINQPLGAILSNADAAELILDDDRDRRDELRQILVDIRRDDRRASEVIRRLRALLERQEIERQPFELNDAVVDAAALLRTEARRSGVTFDIRPAADGAPVVGDRVQIQQVVLNLMLNAVEAVAALAEERRVVTVTVERHESGVGITVGDRGEGIAPEHMEPLFDSFFTTKSKGMGLGLSIARTIIESHGGRIRAESVPGDGAVFHVELPLSHAGSGGGGGRE